MKTKIKDRLLRMVLAVTTAMCFLVSPMTAYQVKSKAITTWLRRRLP